MSWAAITPWNRTRISSEPPACCDNPLFRGFAPAQSSLAILYWAGKGVPQDRIEAYAWLGLAAEQGEREALDGQPGLQAELSDAELQQAWQRAQQYRQGPLVNVTGMLEEEPR